MRPSAVVVAVTIAIAALAPGHAHSPAPGLPVPGQPAPGPRAPVRDRSASPETTPTGTATIKGSVVDAATGAPVGRATVTARDRATGGSVTTDAEGRFEIRGLPAGRYTVFADKAGYVTTPFGRTGPGRIPLPIALGDGEVAERVTIPLAPGGVITGLVLDDIGGPLARSQVQALRVRMVDGRRRLDQNFSATDTTDDRGAFRIFGLQPGEYFVTAGNEIRMQSVQEGRFRNDTAGIAPTYYPGVLAPSEARSVTVQAGQETGGVIFPVVIARLASIHGRVLDPSASPTERTMLTIVPKHDELQMTMRMSHGVRPDGTFELRNVPPGRYQLVARRTNGSRPSPEYAVADVTLDTDDIEVTMTMQPGATVRGRLVSDEGTPLPVDASSIRLSFVSRGPVDLAGAPEPSIHDDFTFEATGLYGTVAAFVYIPGTEEWSTKAILHEGRDVVDTGLTIEPGRPAEDIEIVLTRRRAEVTGIVTDNQGRPVLDAVVLVFPVNREQWTWQSRFISTARPDQNGRFVIRGLPPAEAYRIVALEDTIDLLDTRSADFLESIVDIARPLSLSEGEKKVQNLRISPR